MTAKPLPRNPAAPALKNAPVARTGVVMPQDIFMAGSGGPMAPPSPWVLGPGYIQYQNGGVVIGAPSGGNMGNGILNVADLYVNGQRFDPASEVPEAPNDGQTYGRKSKGWTPALPLTGGTLTGVVRIANAAGISNPWLFLDAPAAGVPRYITGTLTGKDRWIMALGDSSAESGSNAGSNFTLSAIPDSGTGGLSVMTANRATGIVNFPQIPTTATAAPGDSSNNLATTAFVAGFLPLPGGTLTGNLILNHVAADAVGPWLIAQKARGTPSAPAIVQTLDYVGRWDWQAYSGSGYVDTAWIGAQIIEPTPGALAMGSSVNLWATPVGALVPAQVAMFATAQTKLLNYFAVQDGGMANGANWTYAAINLVTNPTSQRTSIELDQFSNQAIGPTLYMAAGRGTLSAPAVSVTNDTLAGLMIRGWDGTGWHNALQITATLIDPAPSPTSFRTQFNFLTVKTGSSALITALSLHDTQLTLALGQGITSTATGAAQNWIVLASETGSSNITAKRSSNDALANYYAFFKSRGTNAAPAVVAQNDTCGTLYLASAYNGSTYTNSVVMTGKTIDPAPSTASMQSQFILSLVAAGSVSSFAALAIDSTNGIAVGASMPISGLGGISMGSALAASTFDCTRHLAIYGTGAAAYGINVTSGQMNFATNGTSPLALTSSTLALHPTAGNAVITINKASGTLGTLAQLAGQVAGQNRWLMNMGDGSNEAGSNAGSNWALNAYTDVGGLIGSVISAVRSTQVVTFSQPIVNGSDRALKENIEEITGALATVHRLVGVSFNRIARPDKRELGFIAQDVEPVVPEVIEPFDDFAPGSETETRTLLGLAYTQLIALVVEAIKELDDKVEALSARLEGGR